MPYRRQRHRGRWQTVPLRLLPSHVLAQPFGIFLTMLCVLAGVPLLLGAPTSDPVQAAMPGPLVKVWALMLSVGGGIAFYGLITNRGRVWERLGMDLLAPASLAYSVAVIAFAGWKGLFTAAITIAFSLACWSRAYVLRLGARLDRLVDRHGE